MAGGDSCVDACVDNTFFQFLCNIFYFLPPEVDTPDDGTKEVKEDETADTNDDDGIEGRDGKDEGNDKQADADEEDNDTPVGSVPSKGAPPVSVPFFGGRPRLGLDDRASTGIT